MNPKPRILATLALTLFTVAGLGAETVIDQMYGARRYELADAYYAAGQRFIELGQAARGAEFKAQALRIFPGFVPGQLPQTTLVSAPTATPVPAPALREQTIQGEKVARLQFQKLLRGYLAGSASTLAAALAPAVEVQGQATQPDNAMVAAFLQAHPAAAGTPGELFLMESLEVAAGEDEAVVITVRAHPQAPGDLASFLPFWKETQTYTFSRMGETWKLTKVGGQ